MNITLSVTEIIELSLAAFVILGYGGIYLHTKWKWRNNR